MGYVIAVLAVLWVIARLKIYCDHYPYSRRIWPDGPFGDWL